MAIEIFCSPRKGGVGGVIFFSKMILQASPPLATKKFQSQSDIPHHWMAIKRGGAYVIILGKKKSSSLSLLGNQRILVAIQ
jgi:hypothetical protein